MDKIKATTKTVRELLGNKYAIDYYQREYKWEAKNITELLDDLEKKFLESYKEGHSRIKVKEYGHYFLGSIVNSQSEGQNFIIDGQQRLTSLTLLLIYLNNLQQVRPDSERVNVQPLIFSAQFGEKSFNLDIPERRACMETLFSNQPYGATDQPDAVQTIVDRYDDIEEFFPKELKGKALPYFIDWLLERVDLVEITAYSDEDAYTIFETMNDRGLRLSPTDMLKGYLLANITDPEQRMAPTKVWTQRMADLAAFGKEEDADFFKAWLRAKYAETIRERKKHATNEDFDIIGTAFHKWVRDNKDRLGLETDAAYYDFIAKRFERFSRQYMRLRRAGQKLTPGLEYVYYNALNNFTLQYPAMLAPLRLEDDQETMDRKCRLVAGYIDILIFRRAVNFKMLDYSTMVYAMFLLMKEIRDLHFPALAALLKQKVEGLWETTEAVSQFHLNQWSKRYVHYILARMTHHIEEQCGVPSGFEAYMSRKIKKPFEIEHIWAHRPERHVEEFEFSWQFYEYRNRFGDLLLLPRGFNQSLGDDTYDVKVKAYFGQNLLAKSLNAQCYQNNPSFMAYIKRSGLPFQPHSEFKKSDLDQRQDLYRRICEEIWSTERFTKVMCHDADAGA